MDYEKIFLQITDEINTAGNPGQVASYIPELSRVDASRFGIHLTTVKGRSYCYGDANEKFSIQSIAKVLALTLAFNLEDDQLWERVGVEPSGTSFNSLLQLEYEKGIPRNPLINAGALVICDVLVSRLKNPRQELIDFIRGLAGDQSIDYCPRVARSEKITGYKNAALINLIKSYGNICNDIDTVFNLHGLEGLHGVTSSARVDISCRLSDIGDSADQYASPLCASISIGYHSSSVCPDRQVHKEICLS